MESRSFRINGEQVTPAAAPSGQKLSQWIETLRSRYAALGEIVTELCVDGMRLVSDDPRLALIPVESTTEVEVFTRPKTEVALETLEGLIPYLEETATVCEGIPSLTQTADRALGLRKLCEGLELLTDTLETAKQALGLNTQDIRTQDGECVAVLEADLLSILQDWADCQSRDDRKYEKDLLETHLPKNLRAWAAAGIPALVR